MLPGGSQTDLRDLRTVRHVFLGLAMYYIGPAQNLRTAGWGSISG